MKLSGKLVANCSNIEGMAYPLVERLLRELVAAGWDTKDLVVLYRRI